VSGAKGPLFPPHVDHLERIRVELRQVMGAWQVCYQRLIAIPPAMLECDTDGNMYADRLNAKEFMGVAECCENALIRLDEIAQEQPQ